MRNHRLTARLIVASLFLTLFFTAGCRQAQAQEQSPTTEVDGLKSKFEQFHQRGFGIESVTNEKSVVSTSGKGSNMLDTLGPAAQESALRFLRLPASGQWNNADVDRAYGLFMANADAHDQDSSVGHFIKASYQFGKENYDVCILEIDMCLKRDPGYVPAFKMRALCEFKVGNIERARKDWSKAESLSVNTTSGSAEVWISKIVSTMKSNWKDEIRKQGKSQVHPTINIVVTIEKDGTISNTKITQSSGIAKLDRLAQEACLKSSPVNPPPPGLFTPAQVLLGFEKRLKDR